MDGFIGEIRAFSFPFVPRGWLLCDGRGYSYSSNSDYFYLFNVIQAKYGINYQDGTFNVPNLQGRVAVGAGAIPGGGGYYLAQNGGYTDVALQIYEMPPHSHTAYGMVTSDTSSAPLKEVSKPDSSCYPSNVFEVPPYTTKRMGLAYNAALQPAAALNSNTVSVFQGGNGLHNNMQPYLTMLYCICYDGQWPPRPGQPEKPEKPSF
ncbi:MAG: tail fiber protein [Chitinophagaceae bacterium]